ncbi:MAG: hypothetical protein WC742_00250 [Gallionellaceae bacterium]|jgi:hypothetical protein
MSDMEKASYGEAISGSLVAKLGAAFFAATTPYVPIAVMFLPILCDSFAQGRHQKRIEKAINDLNRELEVQRAIIDNLSDAQFKFINETILTFLQTMEEEKLAYLKHAIRVCVTASDMTHIEASVLSRIIRDISVDEIRLLTSNSGYGGIVIVRSDNETDYAQHHAMLQDTPANNTLVSGLISLGLVVLDDNVFGNTYRFTPIVKKLLALMDETTPQVQTA